MGGSRFQAKLAREFSLLCAEPAEVAFAPLSRRMRTDRGRPAPVANMDHQKIIERTADDCRKAVASPAATCKPHKGKAAMGRAAKGDQEQSWRGVRRTRRASAIAHQLELSEATVKRYAADAKKVT